MSVFFISDTHFSHRAIIKYSTRTFSSVDEMDETMIDNWNKLVKPTDTVWHLGDFSFARGGALEEILRRLNGSINLCPGNHDKEIIKNIQWLLDEKLFASIQHYKELKGYLPDRLPIVLFHYGMRVWNKSHFGSIHLYGHSHGSLPPHGKSVDVGVDCKEITDEYRPIHLDEVLQYMSTRNYERVDHHRARGEVE